MSAVEPLIQKHLPQAITLRHRLHQIPELGYQEHKTAAVLRAELTRLNIPFVEGPASAPTATIAWIGDASKPCIALRADIDALPITEKTSLPYASAHPGQMHACGHDGHMTTLVTTAAILKQLADRNDLPVCVKLIFQPAEEGGGGADRLVKAGVLDGRIGPKVSAIFGLHGWPALKVGIVATRPGALLAATDKFHVTFIGKGCHAAFPHTGTDPIVAAAQAVLSLQHFVSRETDPTEPAVVTVGIFKAGTAENVIPDTALIEGTARTLTPDLRKKIKESIHRRCQGIAQAGACDLDFRWEDGYPPTVNDPAMTAYVAKVARSTFGEDRFLTVPRPAMGGEDFAYYLEQIPGAFFLVGVEPANQNTYPTLHSDQYDFTDAALETAITMFVSLARNWGES
jgi:amidohydrolase